MDNGLIFPYPRRNAHAEPSDADPPKPLAPFGVRVEVAGDPNW